MLSTNKEVSSKVAIVYRLAKKLTLEESHELWNILDDLACTAYIAGIRDFER